MAIPEQLAFGRTGWHGDQAVSLRSSLGAMSTLANELKADHNAVLAKLDLDGGVADADYAALHTVAAANVDAAVAASEHIANGGSYSHGDDAVKLRLAMESIATMSNDMQTEHDGLLAKLDADATVADADYAALHATTATAIGSISAHFAQGGSSVHGDAGVQVRLALQSVQTLANEIKTQRNLVMAKLDADGGVADADYAALHTTAAADI